MFCTRRGTTFDTLSLQTTSQIRLNPRATTSQSLPFNMVMGLRRVVLGIQALLSTSPLQLHASLPTARHTLASLWSTSSARFLSTDHTNSILSEKSSATNEQDDAAKLAKKAYNWRHYQKVIKQRRLTDAEYVRKRRENDRDRWYERPLHQSMAYRKASAKQRAHRKQIDPAYAFFHAVRDWVRRYQWVRESLPWKTHTPVYYNHKVEHTCTKCLVTRFGGVKLWWQKRDVPGQDDNKSYECHHCHCTGLDKLPKATRTSLNLRWQRSGRARSS